MVKIRFIIQKKYGQAQLDWHLTGDQEVAGSVPAEPGKFLHED